MRVLAKIIPSKLKRKYEENALYARIKDPERAIGFSIFNGFVLAIIFALIFSRFFNIIITISFGIVIFFFIEVFFYYSFVLRADNVAQKIEKILPDVLQFMASNLRAGMTTEKALLLSSRDEFGLLKKEIDRIGREIATGKGIIPALESMANRFKSEKLKKSVQLIGSGLSAGGELAPLLEQISSNLRESDFVEKKVRSNVLMYVIFIFVAVAVGAPALFGLSSFLVEVLTSQITNIEIPAASQLPVSISGVSINPQFILIYLTALIIVTCILGSLVIGLISKGEEKEGIKYIPFMLSVALIIFFATRYIVKNMLAGLFGMG
ncbi:MAG: type II secretion system F family protein [Nanoarchaeota archaeon]|nr:type II secretion system F family protein [Nanoarchaeota archaeon]